MCQSAWTLVHSLIGELLAPRRNKITLSRCTCSDLVPLERSGPVPALEMGMCLWCACVVFVSVSVSVGWCSVVSLLSSLWCCLSVVVWSIVVDALSAVP